MTARTVGISLDHSKHPITCETFNLPVPLPEWSWLGARIDAIFQDEKIHVEEVTKFGIDPD